MSSTTSILEEKQLYAVLKSEIITLATALYGTTSPDPTSTFDILPSLQHLPTQPRIHNVMLIMYTSPGSFTSWAQLMSTTSAASVNEAMGFLLEKLQLLMGALADVLSRDSGDEEVRHDVVPDYRLLEQLERCL